MLQQVLRGPTALIFSVDSMQTQHCSIFMKDFQVNLQTRDPDKSSYKEQTESKRYRALQKLSSEGDNWGMVHINLQKCVHFNAQRQESHWLNIRKAEYPNHISESFKTVCSRIQGELIPLSLFVTNDNFARIGGRTYLETLGWIKSVLSISRAGDNHNKLNFWVSWRNVHLLWEQIIMCLRTSPRNAAKGSVGSLGMIKQTHMAFLYIKLTCEDMASCLSASFADWESTSKSS